MSTNRRDESEWKDEDPEDELAENEDHAVENECEDEDAVVDEQQPPGPASSEERRRVRFDSGNIETDQLPVAGSRTIAQFGDADPEVPNRARSGKRISLDNTVTELGSGGNRLKKRISEVPKHSTQKAPSKKRISFDDKISIEFGNEGQDESSNNSVNREQNTKVTRGNLTVNRSIFTSFRRNRSVRSRRHLSGSMVSARRIRNLRGTLRGTITAGGNMREGMKQYIGSNAAFSKRNLFAGHTHFSPDNVASPVIEIVDPQSQLEEGDRVYCQRRSREATVIHVDTLSGYFVILYDDELEEEMTSDEVVRYLKKVKTDEETSLLGSVDEAKASIPSWSVQDRMPRATVTPSIFKVILSSPFFIGAIFCLVYLIPEVFTPPDNRELYSSIVISVFILINTFVTLLQAVPGEDQSDAEVNAQVNASILIAMILYPCFGLWMMERTQLLTPSNFWTELGFDNFYETKSDFGKYQWGYIFPFFFWAFTSVILLRDSNYAFTLDRQGVISDENGKAVTALYRRIPTFYEVWLHRICRYLSFSLWTIIPTRYRPAGSGGRFAFKIISPLVLSFFWVGYRFIKFSSQEIAHIISTPGDYTRLQEIKIEIEAKDLTRQGSIAQARTVVWAVFAVYCILIRAVIGRKDFLALAIKDPQSLKHRWVGWTRTMIESKRRRVLWAFRGLANAGVQYYVYSKGAGQPETFFEWFMYYSFLCVYISFLCEGIGAFFFALSEAERGCHLKTPFNLLAEDAFWCGFNAFLQPLGTVCNAIFYFVNKEFVMGLHLREFFSPLLLNERNLFRVKKGLPTCCRKVKVVTEEEIEDNLVEWLSTWKRKRRDVGRDVKNFVVKRLVDGEEYPVFSGQLVFRGTLFPTHDEWLYMYNNYQKYVTLMPWDKSTGEEKFLQWYPSHREEIIKLLREPYDFTNRREVWMFGYGSLISPNSPPAGLSEVQRKQIIPYWLKKQSGYRRVWNYRHGPVGINAFGLELVENDDDAMNVSGCVYPMDYEKASDLFSFREEGYELLLVHESYFEPMHNDFVMPKGAGYIWVCGQPTKKDDDEPHDVMESSATSLKQTSKSVSGGALSSMLEASEPSRSSSSTPPERQNTADTVDTSSTSRASSEDFSREIDACPNINIKSKRHYPTNDSPILQSYIDTVMEGALRYSTAGLGHNDGMNFAASILRSTAGWNFPWYNDRIMPGRPWSYMPKYELIDGLLSTCPTSRDAFPYRLRTSMQQLHEKRPMLEGEKEENIPWAKTFYGS